MGEGFNKLDLGRREGAHLGATCTKGSDEFPLLSKGNKQKGASAASDTQPWKIVLCSAGVGNMKCAMLAHPTISWIINTDLYEASDYWYRTYSSPRDQTVPFAESERHVVNPANPGGALDDGIEHWLHVRGRAADDAEHFRCSRLMLQGFPQLCIPFLQFFEEADIFDGDYRLVSEDFKEANLLFRKRPNFSPANQDSPNRGSLTTQRSSKNRSSRIRPLQWSRLRIFAVKVFRNIIHVNGLSVQNSPSACSEAI